MKASSANNSSNSQPNENNDSKVKKTSRRTFIRNVGKTLLSITVVGWVGTSAKMAFACGEGVSDSTCGNNYGSDANCGISSDRDNNCGTSPQQSHDSNCGNPSSSGTGGPNGTDVDESCTAAVTDSDHNCSIAQVPTGGVDKDESCNAVGGDADESCGDCDDNHNADEHCGKPITGGGRDPDDLCGHQSAFGGTQDAACSATVKDVGCGTHVTEYGGTWNDPDNNCHVNGGQGYDMNCSGAIMDSNCGVTSNPSTTSPDESCSATNADIACSRYDKDESCGSGNEDQSCGTTTIKNWFDPVDDDENCGVGSDPDDSRSTTTCIQGGG